MLQNKDEEFESTIAGLSKSLNDLYRSLTSLNSGQKIVSKLDQNSIDILKRDSNNEQVFTNINNPSKIKDPGYQSFYNEFQEHKQKFDKMTKKLNELRKKFKKEGDDSISSLKYDSIDNENNNNNPKNENNISNTNIIVENQTINTTNTGANNTQLLKMINLLSENIRVININMSLKTPREEMESVIKILTSELDRIRSSMGEALSKMDLRIKSANEGALSRSIDKDEIVRIYFYLVTYPKGLW